MSIVLDSFLSFGCQLCQTPRRPQPMAFGLQQLFLSDTAGRLIQFLLLKTQQVFLLGPLLQHSGKPSAFFAETYPITMDGSILRPRFQQTAEGIQYLKLSGV